MLIDRPSVREGSRIVNAVVASGTVDPATADVGELFYRTDLGQLRTFGGLGWQEVVVGTGSGSISGHIADTALHLTANQNTFLDAINLPTITGAHVNSIPTLTSTVSGLSSTVGTHVVDTALHLSAGQNALLDALSPTLTATQLNFVEGVTSSIQTQINTATGNLSSHAADGTLHLNANENAFLNALDFVAETATVKAGSVNGLTTHLASTILHLSPNQNTFLDGLNLPTLQATEVNYLIGTTSSIQTQLNGKVDLSGDTMSGNLVMAGFRVTGLPASPSDPSDAVSQAYVDGLAQGLSWQMSVLVATTGPIALTGSQTIDGVALSTSNLRVLVKNQVDPALNGIYLTNASGPWSRSPGADSAAELDGAAVFVQQGVVNADTAWVQTGTITNLGVDALSFSQFAAAGGAIGGNGIQITGSNISVRAGNGLTFGAPTANDLTLNVTSSFTLGTQLDLSNVGTAGTFGSTTAVPTFTTDTKGRITGASNAINISSSATPSTVVSRDGAGNFSATSITAALVGNASTATALQNARTIALSGGVTGTATSFNGSANISIPVTAVDSAVLTGTIPTARLSGSYNITNTGASASLSISNQTDANADRGVGLFTFSNTSGSINFPAVAGQTIETRRASGGAADVGTLQVWSGADASENLYYRKVVGFSAGDVWSPWRILLSEANYNSFAPSLTGAGASGTWGISISGNAATATTSTNTTGNAATATALQTARTINGTSFNGTANITVLASTPNTITFNSSGTGAGSGSAFNGASPVTISYNTIGAPSATGNGASGTWNISVTGNAATATATTGNAATATTLQTARNISLSGVTSTAQSFNGSTDIIIPVTAVPATLLTGTIADARIAGSYTGFVNLTMTGTLTVGNDIVFTGSSSVLRNSAETGYSAMSGGVGVSTGANIICYGNAATPASTGRLRVANSNVLEWVTGAVTVTGSITASGDITAFSDKRLKKDIEPVWNALDKVKSLNGVTFKRIDTNEYGVGLIAQDVAAVVPEAVKHHDDGMMSVAYGNMVGVLVEAIKEMSTQIDALRAELAVAKGAK